MIQVQNTPTQLREPLKQYLQNGYVVLSNIFDANQIDISFQEWNYQTKSRGIDLSNSTTWDNIHGQHDWQQGWAKWLHTSGIQVCNLYLIYSLYVYGKIKTTIGICKYTSSHICICCCSHQ